MKRLTKMGLVNVILTVSFIFIVSVMASLAVAEKYFVCDHIPYGSIMQKIPVYLYIDCKPASGGFECMMPGK